MPAFKNRTDDEIINQFNSEKEYKPVVDNQETTPDLMISAAEVTPNDIDIEDPQKIYRICERIRKNSPIAGRLLQMLKMPILNTWYTIEKPNDSEESRLSQEYLQFCFDQFADGYSDFIYHDLLSLDLGVSLFEKVYENGVDFVDSTGKRYITNIIRRMSPIQQSTIYRWIYNRYQDFTGIEMYVYHDDMSNEMIIVPANKLYLHTHNKEFRNIRGNTEYRPIIETYNIKQRIIKSVARKTARGAGVPELKVNTTDERILAAANMIGRTLGNADNAYVITNPDIDFTLHSLTDQEHSMEFLDFLNREMFFNFLSQFMTSGIGGNGSRAATESEQLQVVQVAD